MRAAAGLPRAAARARPRCPGRSPVFSGAIQLLKKYAQPCDGRAARRRVRHEHRRSHPTFAYGFRHLSVIQHFTPSFPWWDELRDDSVAVGDEHGFPAGGEADVLTELVLEDLDSD